MSSYKTEDKLITQTGSHKKVLINMEIAEKALEPEMLRMLNNILIELNHVHETMKQCARCKEIKQISYEFYKHEASGRISSYCRDCRNEESRVRHKEKYWNDEEYREKQKARSRAGE
jgi:Cft2 family RNA processing exonuclease